MKKKKNYFIQRFPATIGHRSWCGSVAGQGRGIIGIGIRAVQYLDFATYHLFDPNSDSECPPKI